MRIIKDKRFDVFSDIIFNEEFHTYTRNGKKFSKSGTKICESFQHPFEKEFLSKKVAFKRGVSPEVVLAEWELTGLKARERGNVLHKFLEDLWNTGKENLTIPSHVIKLMEEDKEYKESFDPMLDTAYNWWLSTKEKWQFVGAEIVIGDNDLDIAGMIDVVFQQDNDLIIFDNKQGKEITKVDAYGKKLKKEFSRFPQSKFHIYSMQLSLYALILERNGIYVKDLIVGHFGDKYTEFQCIDMRPMFKKHFGLK